MKFSNFLFPAVFDPADDHQVCVESLEEAKLCDELGFDVLWLAEHHFDGLCAYVDPVSFASMVVACTDKITVGFAVAQMSLHHPTRFAEQMSLIDNISKGRLIVGLGRGTAYNIYDYQGYGIDPAIAQELLLESEEIMIKAWTQEEMVHEGKHFNVRMPMLRPRPYTKPHPLMIRACSSEGSMVGMAKEGKPFMMNIQTNEETKRRMDLYRATLRKSGYDDAHVAECVDNSWVWRNIYIADTDAEAEKKAPEFFLKQAEHRTKMRKRIYEEQGLFLKKEDGKPAARNDIKHGIVYGSPETVAEKLAEIDDIGVGGLIATFRVGDMSYAETEHSLRLFMDKVAPELNSRTTAAAAE